MLRRSPSVEASVANQTVPFRSPGRAQPRSLSRQSDPESIQALLFDILVKLDYNYVYQSPPFFCR